MKVEVKDAPRSQKELSIEIPYETFEQEMEKETSKIAQTAKIPGFRPGKAPKDVVKKQHLHNIRSGALDSLINNAVRDALISNNINPLSQPSVEKVTLEDDKPITFNVKVDVFPTVVVGKFSGYDFAKTTITVSNEDVEESIARFREQATEFQPVKNARALAKGDQAVFDFLGKVDGVAFEGGAAKGHTLEIGSGQFIPGFEDGMIGMALHDVRDVPVKFPEEYHAKDLAGKDAVFTVTLNEIKEKVQPELNDEFAKKFSPHFDTFEKFRNAVKKDLENEARQQSKQETFSKILDKLLGENQFEVPMAIVMEQAERMAQQNMQRYYQMGIDPTRFGMTIEALAMEMAGEAETQVKRALMINQVAADNKFEANEDDIKKEIAEAAEFSGRPVEDIEKDVFSNEQYMLSIKNEIVSDKVYDFLQSQNKIAETVMSKKEFEAKMKAEAEAAQAERIVEAADGEQA
jgi:trigger factor